MSVEVKKLENSQVEIKLNLEGDKVKAAKDSVLANLSKRVELPGFRKGKAPVSAIEAQYGSAINEEVAERLIKENYETIINENDLKPVDYLQTVSIKLDDNKFEGLFVVDIYPELTLGDYKGLEVEKENFEMSDDLLNTEIQKLVDASSKLVEASEGAKAESGDTISLNFEGFVNGEAFEGGKAEDYSLVLGSNSFIAGFEDQLIGYEAGQEGEVNVTFPEEYFKAELAGQPAMFKVKVNNIKKLEKPELDDEFAKDQGFDNLEDLNTKKRDEIVARETSRIESAYKNELINKVVENATIAVPASMTNREVKARLNEFENNLKMQGANLDMYMKMYGLTQEGLVDQIKPMAEAKVKTDIVLGEIAKLESVEVSEDEVKEKVAEMAKMYNMEVEKLEEELTKAGNLDHFMENLKSDIEIAKTIDLIVDNAK